MTDERKDWLERRRQAIGASDVAAILGVEGAWGTRLSVYNSKVLGVEQEQTDQMLMGLASEAGIAALYTKHTGRVVEDPRPYTIRKHHGAPLACTLDRFITGPDFRGPLQLKASGGSWGDDPPLAYVVQVQAEMACTGEKQAALAGWVGGRNFVHHEIPRDEEFQATMIVAVIAFWTNHIERRIPPEPTALDARALQKLYPKDQGSTIALNDTALQLADERDDLTAQIKHAEELKDLASNRLKAALGEATFGILPDGTRMSWKLQKRKEHIVAASEPRVLRRLKAPRGKR
jgi:predicted phage-related endonuclease